MSDIHGCYDDMLMMIEKIKLSDEDVLVFAGDYIDRGPKSYEMINITPIDLFILGLEVGIGAYLLVKEKENKGG